MGRDVSDQQRLAAVLVGFARTLADADGLEEILHQLGQHVLAVVPAAGAGVSLADSHGRLHFLPGTDAIFARLEGGRDDLREGPSRDAYEKGAPVVASDLGHTGRWPRFRDSAIAAGVHAAAGIPLLARQSCIGALSLYRSEVQAFTDEEVTAARVLADMATGYVVNVRDLERARQLTQELEYALSSRVLIEQAKGYLAAQLSIGMDDAFERLRRHARDHNRRLRDVAEDVLRGGVDPGRFG